ncbi:MAG TPA: hypothetical protein PKE12_15835 [Kiritimatiellia bacterium]|nr:hypothetical protein [Kiritimatiellia bacterium]
MNREVLHSLRRATVRLVLVWAAFVVGVWTVPHRWCMRGADFWYDGDPAVQDALARGVERFVRDGVGLSDFHTGDAVFNGEWLFGSYLMAGFGFGQLALEQPAQAARHRALMRLCIDQLLQPDARAFDRLNWNRDALDALGSDEDHAAYLGYLNLLLGFHRLVESDSPYAELNEKITEHLTTRLAASPIRMLVTYPGEVYPVDNCAAVASIAMHARVNGAEPPPLVREWIANVRARYIDPDTGLLVQALSVAGEPIDDPRGSGTSLGLYLMSFADDALAREWYAALRRSLGRTFLGFGAVREYPAGVHGRGDIDSGPILFGYGLSATGFSIAGARMYGDRAYFRRLYASAHLAGAPLRRGDRLEFVTGGPLGNAILFAMFTAGPGRAAQ